MSAKRNFTTHSYCKNKDFRCLKIKRELIKGHWSYEYTINPMGAILVFGSRSKPNSGSVRTEVSEYTRIHRGTSGTQALVCLIHSMGHD